MKNKSTIAVTAIVLVAVIVRFTWLLLVVNRQWSDVQYYDEAACYLAHHLELRYIDPAIPALHYRAWFPPGWPFFLAFFHLFLGDSPWIVKIVNLILSALIVWLTIQIGTRVFNRRVGLVGGLLWALLPGQIVYVSLSQYEVFLTALMLSMVYLLVMNDWATISWRNTRLHVLGIVMAWATMTRPLLVFLPVALVPYLVQVSGRRRGWLWTTILSAYIGVACLGWGLRNIAVLGEPVIFSTNGGYNLWHGNNPNATGGAFSPPHTSNPRLNPDALGTNELVLNRECYRYAVEYIRANPRRFVTMMPRRLLHLYNTDTTGLYLSFLYSPLDRPTVLERFRRESYFAEAITVRTYLLAMLLVVIGLCIADWRSLQVRLMGYIFLYWHFWVLITFGQDRYRVPIMPLYCLFAGHVVQQLIVMVRARVPAFSRKTIAPHTA